MLTLPRRMELTADQLYKERKIRGFCHLSTGQEGVAVGIEHAISKEDNLITAYRSHWFTYMRGGTIRSIIGELLGRRDGIAHSKGGSMHMYSKGFFGGNGIVGANVPLRTGIAFAQQYQETDNATINLYGDGAANQGQVHESFNMAKLWNLPVVFGCETWPLYPWSVYGMDVLAVLAAVRHARDFVKTGNGHLVYEYVTYRYAGHSMSDPGIAYRSREDLRENRANDPIINLKTRLVDWNIIHGSDKP
ncbi:hypothetical protein N7451_012922 [Penicillium sp. IBT 35674x]|nr:hypothetical protein N7451_012922 [Penicillium sp. IBT 35674x]